MFHTWTERTNQRWPSSLGAEPLATSSSCWEGGVLWAAGHARKCSSDRQRRWCWMVFDLCWITWTLVCSEGTCCACCCCHYCSTSYCLLSRPACVTMHSGPCSPLLPWSSRPAAVSPNLQICLHVDNWRDVIGWLGVSWYLHQQQTLQLMCSIKSLMKTTTHSLSHYWHTHTHTEGALREYQVSIHPFIYLSDNLLMKQIAADAKRSKVAEHHDT